LRKKWSEGYPERSAESDFAQLRGKKQIPPAKGACGMTMGAFFREV
jgi:hypothetical protein